MIPYRLVIAGFVVLLLLVACTPTSSLRVSGEYTLQAITTEAK